MAEFTLQISSLDTALSNKDITMMEFLLLQYLIDEKKMEFGEVRILQSTVIGVNING